MRSSPRLRDHLSELGFDRPLVWGPFKLKAKRGISRYSTTILLAEFLVLWWLFQVASFQFWLDPATYKWLFTVEQLTQITPGWILSAVSHGLDPFAHLIPNVGMLLLFGGLSEPHLRTRDYLLFFVLTGIVASPLFLLLGAGSGNVAGASAPIFGFAMYGPYHYVRDHQDRLSLGDDSTLRSIFTLWMILLPIGVVIHVILQLLGLQPRGDAAVESHAIGLLAGFLLVYLQPAFLKLPCRDDWWFN